MDSAPIITDAKNNDLSLLTEVLTDAFHTDSVMNWVIPDPTLYPEFFQLISRDLFLPRGMVHIERQGRGASMWLPPGVKFEVPPRLALVNMMLKLVWRKGPRPLARMLRQGQIFDRHHPLEPHYHLVFVGCRQHHQGQGVGSALLKQGTRRVDEQHLPAYLESSEARNVTLYQRHGFEVIAQEVLPGGGPRVWFMWREAR